MLTPDLQKEMTTLKRRLKSEIKKTFPSLAPLCRVSSLCRGSANICVTCPMYPDRNPRFEEFLVAYKTTVRTDIDFDIVTTYPWFWRANDDHIGNVATHSCESLAARARYSAVTDGLSCILYSQELFDFQRSRWPANAPLPPHYWEQRQYINEQFQLLCRWIELYGPENVPDIHDISPSMIAVREIPKYRQITDMFEPAW